ncbi:MAG: hypothetical protein ACYDIA_14335 [Candidatus Humimicrobiaceae bacterium]
MNIFYKIVNYEKMYSNYIREINKKYSINIPIVAVPTYQYFKMSFENKEDSLKKISFDISIESKENWNIKVALKSQINSELFYIILHTRIPGDKKYNALPGDKGEYLYTAMRNFYLKESEQFLCCFKEIKASEISKFELKIENFKDLEKIIKYSINGNALVVDNREDIIKSNEIKFLNLEIWSSYYQEREINIKALIQNLEILWE